MYSFLTRNVRLIEALKGIEGLKLQELDNSYTMTEPLTVQELGNMLREVKNNFNEDAKFRLYKYTDCEKFEDIEYFVEDTLFSFRKNLHEMVSTKAKVKINIVVSKFLQNFLLMKDLLSTELYNRLGKQKNYKSEDYFRLVNEVYDSEMTTADVKYGIETTIDMIPSIQAILTENKELLGKQNLTLQLLFNTMRIKTKGSIVLNLVELNNAFGNLIDYSSYMIELVTGPVGMDEIETQLGDLIENFYGDTALIMCDTKEELEKVATILSEKVIKEPVLVNLTYTEPLSTLVITNTYTTIKDFLSCNRELDNRSEAILEIIYNNKDRNNIYNELKKYMADNNKFYKADFEFVTRERYLATVKDLMLLSEYLCKFEKERTDIELKFGNRSIKAKQFGDLAYAIRNYNHEHFKLKECTK